MLQFLLKFNLITPDLHGFLPGESTETALYEFNNYIYENLDEGKHVAKAFDNLDFNYICIKLKALGFRGTFLAFLKSYLSD